MNRVLDTILILVVAQNFLMVGTSHIRVTVRSAAVQGALLGVLPLLGGEGISFRLALVCVGAVVLKGIVIPALLFRATRDSPARRETDPILGLTASLLFLAIGTGLAVVFSRSLPLAAEHEGLLTVPAALSTVFCGMLMLTTRKKAITQVVGYLTLENGIFVFGTLLLEAMPVLVEIGVLLDLFVCVFVMGIILNLIQRTFSSLDSTRLTALKE